MYNKEPQRHPFPIHNPHSWWSITPPRPIVGGHRHSVQSIWTMASISLDAGFHLFGSRHPLLDTIVHIMLDAGFQRWMPASKWIWTQASILLSKWTPCPFLKISDAGIQINLDTGVQFKNIWTPASKLIWMLASISKTFGSRRPPGGAQSSGVLPESSIGWTTSSGCNSTDVRIKRPFPDISSTEGETIGSRYHETENMRINRHQHSSSFPDKDVSNDTHIRSASSSFSVYRTDWTYPEVHEAFICPID